jgi:hypothetical protein
MLASTFVVAPAAGAPLPRLVVVRASNAADCPDAIALALAVERQMQRPALDPTNDEATNDESTRAVYEVRIERSADGYAATIQAGDFTRDLSDPGLTCAELGDALALTLAILLDSEPSAPPPPDPPIPPPPAPVVLPRPTPTTNSSRVSKPIRNWNVAVNAGIGESIGFLTPFSFAVTGDVWFRHRSVMFGAGIFANPWATATDGGKGLVTLRLVTGTLQTCGNFAKKPLGIQFSLCGQAFVGAVYGSGSGHAINRDGNGPWFALGPMGLMERPLTSRLAWTIRTTVVVPVVSQRFTVRRIEDTGADVTETTVSLFEPAKVAWFLGVGLRWTIY